MFLTRGVIYHEAIWDMWFSSAAGLLPLAALSAANCEPGLLDLLRHSCGKQAGSTILQQQHLFSVYVHVGANEKSFTGVCVAAAWVHESVLACTSCTRKISILHLSFSSTAIVTASLLPSLILVSRDVQ